ncbi:MAG: hypothetical protein KA972_05580 [Brachymonas sp.]|nr:hypothetical protein [Brachymonas sp.]
MHIDFGDLRVGYGVAEHGINGFAAPMKVVARFFSLWLSHFKAMEHKVHFGG